MQLKHLNDMWVSFWEALGVPILMILMFIGMLVGIVGPIVYLDKQEDKKPITRRKCQGIRETIDPHVGWSSSLKLCSVAIYDDKDEKIIGFTSYTIMDGKVTRKDVML